MPKIIGISTKSISLGMEDGSVKDVSSDFINFVPHIGDEVEIFEGESKTVISKVEKKEQPSVVINNNNSNTNSNYNINRNLGYGRMRNKFVALALCFFFGIFGAHKFYEGKTGMGVLYIFTIGFLVIGVVFDFIVLLFKPIWYYPR